MSMKQGNYIYNLTLNYYFRLKSKSLYRELKHPKGC